MVPWIPNESVKKLLSYGMSENLKSPFWEVTAHTNLSSSDEKKVAALSEGELLPEERNPIPNVLILLWIGLLAPAMHNNVTF